MRPPFGENTWIALDMYPLKPERGLDHADALDVFLGEQRRRLEARHPSGPGGPPEPENPDKIMARPD